jgi:5-deoxy-glucuronate isomerase
MSLKYHLKSKEILNRVNPDELGLEYTSVQRIELGASMVIYTSGEEVCLVCIQGEFIYEFEGIKEKVHFKDMLYLPCNTRITLFPLELAVIMKYGAPSDLKSEFAHIHFEDVDKDINRHHVYGKKETNCQRHVWNYIDETFSASRLLVGICVSNSGGWTAWPPHEHAEKREEVYVYFNMGNAFGIQCVYEDMDDPLVVAMVRNGDLVSVPKGYHPSVGCPAGKICYIYCMVSKKPGDRSFMDLHVQEIYGDKFE